MVYEEDINYKEELKKIFSDLKSIKTFYRQIPNLLTFSRALGGPVVSAIFLAGHPIFAVIFTGLLFLTDMVDGKLARKFGVVSKFGADLDAFCDKMMFLSLSIPLLISNPIVLLNFIFEGVISLINVVGRINGLNTKTVFSGKIKTWFLSLMLGCGYLVQFLNVPVFLLNTMVGLTFLSQSVAISDYIKEYKKMVNEKKEQLNVEDIEGNDFDKDDGYSNSKKIIDDLKKEKEFVLDSLLLDKEVKPLSKKRKYGKR